MSPEDRHERDKAIVEAWEAGERVTHIAERFNLTESVIYTIVTKNSRLIGTEIAAAAIMNGVDLIEVASRFGLTERSLSQIVEKVERDREESAKRRQVGTARDGSIIRAFDEGAAVVDIAAQHNVHVGVVYAALKRHDRKVRYQHRDNALTTLPTDVRTYVREYLWAKKRTPPVGRKKKRKSVQHENRKSVKENRHG